MRRAASTTRPANLFVAGFIGSPPMNMLAGRISRHAAAPALELGQLTIPLDEARSRARPALAESLGKGIIAGIRPEAFQVAADEPGTPGRICGTVAFVEDLGASLLVHVDLDAGAVVASAVAGENDEMSSARTRLRAVLDGTLGIKGGSRIGLTVDPARIHGPRHGDRAGDHPLTARLDRHQGAAVARAQLPRRNPGEATMPATTIIASISILAALRRLHSALALADRKNTTTWPRVQVRPPIIVELPRRRPGFGAPHCHLPVHAVAAPCKSRAADEGTPTPPAAPGAGERRPSAAITAA